MNGISPFVFNSQQRDFLTEHSTQTGPWLETLITVALAAITLVSICFELQKQGTISIERSLSQWVQEGNAEERRQVASERIRVFLNTPFYMANDLDLSGLNLSRLPDIFNHSTFSLGLRSLDLSKNRLRVLPREIGQLRVLEQLFVSKNQLETLPAEIGQLSSLTLLTLNRNQLQTLPPAIGQLTRLEYLSVCRNPRMTTVPREIGWLGSLQHLYLDYNQLRELPRTIGQLRQLITLHLMENQLTSIPSEIGQLRQLRELGLNYNPNLSELPPEVMELPECVIYR